MPRPPARLDDLLARARDARARRDWPAARDALAQAYREASLPAEEIYALGDACWWLGLMDECRPLFEEAYEAYLREGDERQAVRTAIKIAYAHLMLGDDARASGWLSRASRMLESIPECPERGMLRFLEFESALDEGDLDTALAIAREIRDIASRFPRPDVVSLGLTAEGRALARRGDIARGVALLDEAMLTAVNEELEPGWAGTIYCHLMAACYELGDLGRAGEWTEATMRWCEAMPASGPFLGICRIHRAQILHVQGEWDLAEAELLHVTGVERPPHVATVAGAYYQLGEIRRLRGDRAGAAEAYREAQRLGLDPQPGVALLRLAAGDHADASAAIRRALAGAEHDVLGRAALHAAAVEVALAAGDLDAAEAATATLEDGAQRIRSTALQATACLSRGMLLLAQGEAEDALPMLRNALRHWQQLRAPYEAARTRSLLASAFDAVGDTEAAGIERAAAAEVLGRLGVALAEGASSAARDPDGLTAREDEVLRLLAEGKSNQEIADHLVLSVRTVERHLAAIYQKLGLQGRTARAAAVRHALVRRG